MQHVVRKPTPPFLAAGGALRVHQVPSALDNLVWIAECTASGACAVIDGPEASAALAYADAHGLRITTVLNTHTHGDHVGLNRGLAHRGLLDGLRVVGPARAASDVPGLTQPVDEGDGVTFGQVEGRVLLTEGHLDGHVSYVFGDVLFCGDTLFTGGCGFLFSGPPAKMFDSLLRLAGLPEETQVCCAHEYTQDNLRFAWMVEPGNSALAERIARVWALRAEGGCAVPSTVADERATNPFLRPGSSELIARVRELSPGVVLDRPVEVFAATRALKDRGLHKDTVVPV